MTAPSFLIKTATFEQEDIGQISVNPAINQMASFSIALDDKDGKANFKLAADDVVDIFVKQKRQVHLINGIIKESTQSFSSSGRVLELTGFDQMGFIASQRRKSQTTTTYAGSREASNIITAGGDGLGLAVPEATYADVNVTAKNMTDFQAPNNKSIMDLYRELGDASGFDFYYDVDKKLQFFANQGIIHPLDITQKNLISYDITDDTTTKIDVVVVNYSGGTVAVGNTTYTTNKVHEITDNSITDADAATDLATALKSKLDSNIKRGSIVIKGEEIVEGSLVRVFDDELEESFVARDVRYDLSTSGFTTTIGVDNITWADLLP